MSGTDTPGDLALMQALDATWPPQRVWHDGPFLMRDGAGGGQRVSATFLKPGANPDEAIDLIHKMESPLFRVLEGDDDQARLLERAGLQRHDTTLFRVGPAADIATKPGPAKVFFGWPVLEAHRRVWAKGGIGPARIEVMQRAPGTKTALLGRLGDAPVATGFVAISGDIAMLHALEVLPEARRCGVGRTLTEAAADWAVSQGARWLGLAVTKANTGANALYEGLGLAHVGGYHYRTSKDHA